MTSKSQTPEAPLNEPTPPSTTADDSMTNEQKDDMADQMEDFEGVVQWGLGLSKLACYRAFFLTNPTRLVIDVQTT